jgi:hypothetical protein
LCVSENDPTYQIASIRLFVIPVRLFRRNERGFIQWPERSLLRGVLIEMVGTPRCGVPVRVQRTEPRLSTKPLRLALRRALSLPFQATAVFSVRFPAPAAYDRKRK